MATTVNKPLFTYWQWRGRQVHYVAAGTDRPGTPLLLVHGFGASTDHWRKNIGPLSTERPVYAIDLLGFGRSAKPNLTYSGELWRDQLHDFVAEIVGRPVIAAGNSLGGYASLVFAVDHPDMVRALALLNGAGPFSDTVKPEGVQKLVGEITMGVLRQPWASWLVFQYSRQRSTIRRVLLQVYRDKGAVTDELVEDIYRPSCDPGAAEVFAAVFQTPPGRPVDALLTELHCPVLLLWGDSDPWMSVARAERFKAAYPAAKLQLVPAGHCPHDERPELVNRHLQEWAVDLCL
jgi:pimeloyl-ACP methyl ester carboxylesterase